MPRAGRIALLLGPLIAACQGTGKVPSTCDTVLTATGADVRIDGGTCAVATLTAAADPELTVTFAVDALQRLTPTVTAGPVGATFHRLALSGPWSLAGDAPPVWWRQGYQSWSWSGVTAVADAELDADGLPTLGGDVDALGTLDETPWTSWWAGLLARPGGGLLQVGALSAATTKTWIAASPTTLWITWGGRGEAVELAPGASLTLDPVWVASGADPTTAWTDWADQVAERIPPRGLDAPAPTGWSDWYEVYGKGDEAGLRTQLAAVAAEGRLEVFQVDDGWEVAWGEWTANERYPSGTATLARDIAATGLTPGLWMAPFYVDRSTATFLDHPTWWVRDASGETLGTAACDCAILDVTEPDAADWLTARIQEKVAEGWVYLKLDFLYAGAQEGVRSQDVTGAQAYALSMQLLRRAAGDAWILGCGAPMLPSVGFIESWRSGTDIALAAAPDPSPAFLRWQARSTAARAFVNGRWWWNDPDNLLVRALFDAVQARGAIAAQVASGGTWLLGDNLADVDAPTRALLTSPSLLDLRGQTAEPADPLAYLSGIDGSPLFEASAGDDTVPTTWLLADGTVVLLNLGEAPVTVDGPGGTELLSGTVAGPGARTLEPGAGEVWAP